MMPRLKPFERAARKQIVAALKAGPPADWKIWKKNRRAFWRKLLISKIIGHGACVLLAGTCCFMTGFSFDDGYLRSLILAGCGGWLLLLIGLIAYNRLYRGAELLTPSHWPIPDKAYLRWTWKKACVGSLSWCAGFALVCIGATWQEAFPLGPWIDYAILLLAQAVCLGGLVLLLATPGIGKFLWEKARGNWIVPLGVLLVCLGLPQFFDSPKVEDILGFTLFDFLSFLPTGWGLLILRDGVIGHHPQVWYFLLFLLIPPLLAALLLPRQAMTYRMDSERGLLRCSAEAARELRVAERRLSSPPSTAAAGTADQSAQGAAEKLPEDDSAARLQAERESEAAAAAVARTGAFLRPWNWAEFSVIERIVGFTLTARERTVAELLLAEPPRWTRRFRNGLKFLALGAVLFYVNPDGLGGTAGIVLFVFALLAMSPALGGLWPGLSARPAGEKIVAMHGVFPVGIREAGRIFLKTNLTRVLFAAPWILAAIAYGEWVRRFSWTDGVTWGGKTVYLLAMAQPFWLMTRTFPSWDGGRGFFRKLFLFSLLILAIIAITVGGAVFLLSEESFWPAGAIVLGTAFASWQFAMYMVERGRLDLVAMPMPTA